MRVYTQEERVFIKENAAHNLLHIETKTERMLGSSKNLKDVRSIAITIRYLTETTWDGEKIHDLIVLLSNLSKECGESIESLAKIIDETPKRVFDYTVAIRAEQYAREKKLNEEYINAVIWDRPSKVIVPIKKVIHEVVCLCGAKFRTKEEELCLKCRKEALKKSNLKTKEEKELNKQSARQEREDRKKIMTCSTECILKELGDYE